MMNIKKSCYLVLFLLVLGNLSASAHEMPLRFLQGKWTIPSSDSKSPARVLFHGGHENISASKKPLAIFNLCTDKDDKLYGIVTNNLTYQYPVELKVASADFWVSDNPEFQDHTYHLILRPYGDDNSIDLIVSVTFVYEEERGEKAISIAFDDYDGGALFLASRKNNRPSPACLKHMRKEKRASLNK